ncbi:conserved hypothetical protein [Chlorobium limicola DSM 245]|uniref:Uncharacterized protein n=1 Tax=Chlorobium limicola (strain DSM 245 / NBRC 103803 / 6330) TaxID=290315 RepID=B3EII2_CHLL2|nr:hypothetical protein [Chlorobium limicola]ACD91494.1 conserved hypothetical protein [Chlorobium limicola DSM 245]
MFEVTGIDIGNLGDADLRELVKKLAIAELRGQGCPISSVIAGGNQDAPDGGIDVRIDCPITIQQPDFIKRQQTGFQVKKPDMPASAIREEMRPNNELRDVIRELADVSGSYIIVSVQGSVADKALNDRRHAIRDALHDLPNAEQLHSDFYDRDRLADWVNEYPGVATWVRSRVGRPITGWINITDCCEGSGGKTKPYLFNEKACLIDERSPEREQLPILEGINRLRAALRIHRQCIRLIGLSGLGKTRLIQALFEDTVGEDALDSSIALYTDFSEEGIEPTAHEMARNLVQNGQRVILIVDNCNPKIHTDLVKLCTVNDSKVSLITVEYDVREDEPEQTEVFRLQSTDPDLVAQWLGQLFPDISQIDRKKIAEFSDGNFRVARALAQTLGKGETLGSLNSKELFERIFWQRNQNDRPLLRAAEILSLLYSIDGENTEAEGELALVGRLLGFGASELYGALVELRGRGVVQARSCWRAVLPQAIANPLASSALKRIPPSDVDRFCSTLTPRMLKSMSRRLGYLHDSREVQSLVARWLNPDGALGDQFGLGEQGFHVITNIAPVAPEAVLAKLEQELKGPRANLIIAPGSSVRWQWIHLIKSLAYDAHMFKSAVQLLARFVAAEPDDFNNNSARSAFSELFQLYLSGTQAKPEQRRQAIKELALSGDVELKRSASFALNAHLKAHRFSSKYSFDFGARSRDWGWSPKINKNIWDWYEAAILLAIELEQYLDDAREILARHVRELWIIQPCQDVLDKAASTLATDRPWLEGWMAFKATLRFDGKGMREDVRKKLEQIIDRLKPVDLLNQARAVILGSSGGGWDIVDGEADDDDGMRSWEKASEMAKDIGRELAQDSVARRAFLPELFAAKYAPRDSECGFGLADGAIDLGDIWQELVAEYKAIDSARRNPGALRGFIHGAHLRDATFTSRVLNDAIDDSGLAPLFPYLQTAIGIDNEGIARLRNAIANGVMRSEYFMNIANGSVGDSPEEPLAMLLEDIGALPGGVEVALDILHMHFWRDHKEKRVPGAVVVEVGRNLFVRADFSKKGLNRDFGLKTIIRECLSGEVGESAAKQVCNTIRSQLERYRVTSHDISAVLKALFETQPFIALDTFLLPESLCHHIDLFDVGTPVEVIDENHLKEWADRDPIERYPLIGECLSMFGKNNDDESKEYSSLFLSMLDSAPDKQRFLGDYYPRLHPRSGGSLAVILEHRKTKLIQLAEQSDEEVKHWVDEAMPEIDRWIENERGCDRAREESFE